MLADLVTDRYYSVVIHVGVLVEQQRIEAMTRKAKETDELVDVNI